MSSSIIEVIMGLDIFHDPVPFYHSGHFSKINQFFLFVCKVSLESRSGSKINCIEPVPKNLGNHYILRTSDLMNLYSPKAV